MFGVNVGDGVERVARRIWVAACGQCGAFHGHADFELGRKQVARLQKQQLVIEIAKSLFWLNLQIQTLSHRVAQ